MQTFFEDKVKQRREVVVEIKTHNLNEHECFAIKEATKIN